MPRALILALILALGLTLGLSAARAELFDRVVAVVDDQVILLSELRERAWPELRQAPDEAAARAILERALDQAIDAALIEREAQRMGVLIGDEEVERARAQVQVQNGLDAEAFDRTLLEQGWTRDAYDAQLREQLLRWKILQLVTVSAGDTAREEAMEEAMEEMRRAAYVERRL